MGGKTKQTPRIKNNAKPSSSSRSAELLGTAPNFVGFSAHSELGLVPFAPGFANADSMPETFDSSISSELQLILKKLSKKDPMTKKKALTEFYSHITGSDLDTIKSILPLWPKFYHNLANDIEHNVRELAQTVLQLLVSKCKRAMAPYLKQLIPVWLASHFDSYAPAASIAKNCFRETFAGSPNRTQEVCLHCQAEIVEYASRNLVFHTASTLSSGKGLNPDEAEQKYQRVVLCSLKELSFLVEKTASASDLSQLQVSLEPLLKHNKFWSFSKNKIPAIKAAWFELFYQLLQSSQLAPTIESKKTDLLAVCFQNIDESDPFVAPQVWGCILLLQTNHGDWHATVNFKKSILPKLSSLLRNGFNKNACAICPNLLPFFSKLTQESLQDVNLNDFYMQFFDDLKSAICCTTQSTISKSDHAVIIKTYFECLRFLLQRLNNDATESAAGQTLGMRLLQENVLLPIAWFFDNECAWTKFFFLHAAALVAFLTDRQSSPNSLYAELLSAFWKCICEIITKRLDEKQLSDHFLEHVTQLLNDLHLANPRLEGHYVKFAEVSDKDTAQHAADDRIEMKTSAAAAIQKELKLLVVQLVRLCLANIEAQTSFKYITHVRRLTNMFPDRELYENISSEKNLLATLNLFVRLIDRVDENSSELVLEIIFEILHLLDKAESFSYINSQLLKIPQKNVQLHVLQRLVSYPLCVEPEVPTILSKPEARDIIEQVARDIVVNRSKDKLNLLHKLFSQTDAGDILINQPTVDAILAILSQPFDHADLNDIVDSCGSFIAQIMPVVYSNQNSSREMQRKIFLKLFKFTMEHTANDFISEDTLWEITTCWQDTLSSQDIVIDADMLRECADVVEQRAQAESLPADAIVAMAEAIAKFVICSTEHIEVEEERTQQIDATILAFFHSSANEPATTKHLQELCLFLEALKGIVSLGVALSSNATMCIEIKPILRRTLLNLCTILKLVCRSNVECNQKHNAAELTDDEVTEDYCDPNENILKYWSEVLITEILTCLNISSVTESFVENVLLQFDAELEKLMLELSERVKVFMQDKSEIVNTVKERMLQEAAAETDITNCRALKFLAYNEEYSQFEENATILLAENLSEYFITRNAKKAYVNSLQYLLPNLEQRSITMQMPIMATEITEIWIKAAVFRCLVENNFSGSYNEKSDKAIIAATLQFITLVAENLHTQKGLLLYNEEIQKQPHENVVNAVEYINLLIVVLNNFALELSIKNWDAVRIGLSSWVLSISKSIESYTNPKVAIFIVSVYKLFTALTNVINSEKQKSSTVHLKNVIEEWENLFARDVNLVLFKSFYGLCNSQEAGTQISAGTSSMESSCYVSIIDEITPALELIDYGVVYNFCKSSTKITVDNVCNFLLRNLSNSLHSVRVICMHMLRQLTPFFVAVDASIFEKKSESIEDQEQLAKWHYLNRFEDYIMRYDMPIRKYLDEFSFKPTEITNFLPIKRQEALSYLMLWDCIIFVCANSPVSLRSVYTNCLSENKYAENFLHFLFRGMPVEILKNHDSKIMNNDIFKGLGCSQIKDRDVSLEKYICHLYSEVLRKLPAVVRKWWSTSASRQKTFVDKLTTNFVSLLICQEELKAISNKKEKHENMQVTVHTSTREVLAVYAIDEARMELVITLAQNYPLGGVKVECGKQIGGRSSSRNVGMQLTIFLTHQNGTIFDGLTMWKNNLDKKFEGVEECYVCYTVIHQDTCQLPKLTCKTCKKKFHGPCLYKWFTTSSKSTCPICRNVF